MVGEYRPRSIDLHGRGVSSLDSSQFGEGLSLHWEPFPKAHLDFEVHVDIIVRFCLITCFVDINRIFAYF